MASTEIIVKAMVVKEKNQIMFVESGADFVDVLLRFLTMPMGSIISLIHDCPPSVGIGCMNNLYRSVESLDQKCFRTRECKSMLLQPKNGVETEVNSLKVKIYEHRHWYTCSAVFQKCNHRLLSRYAGALCDCGRPMTLGLVPRESALKDKAHVDDKAVFVKNSTRHLITDDLKIIPMSQTSTLSLLSEYGKANVGATEERTFSIGVKEVVNLLKCSFASETPLTETLLKAEKGSNDQFHSKRKEKEAGKPGDGTVLIKLMVSKSKRVVCYADASEEFVDLLFGFLTVPLGHIFKEMRGAPSKGCAFHLYKSFKGLDAAKCLISDVHKNMLLCPKIAPLFGFEKQLLNVEEALNKKYYCKYERSTDTYTLIERPYCLSFAYRELTVMDPKSLSKKTKKRGGGFLTTPATFTVTDDLIIAPVSPILCLSVLNKMQVSPEDIKEYVVHVGKKEASELLIASFTSETPLTDVFQDVFLRDQN